MTGIWEHQEENFEPEVKLVRASKGKRLANYIIDMLVGYIFAMLAFAIPAVLLELMGVSALASLENINGLVDRLLTMLFFATYYIIVETALKGRSIGKMVTGTLAVTLDGDVPNLETIVKRSFSRIVPFEALSFLGEGDGWHDRWSDTMVIDTNLSEWSKNVTLDEYEY